MSEDRNDKNPFKKPRGNGPRTQAAPAVPSFLPSVLQSQSSSATLFNGGDGKEGKKKKRRRYNALGLTPRKEEYEESEDDADEESRLAQDGQQ